MTNELFISEEELLKLQAKHKLRAILQQEKRVYVKTLHRRCAVGLSSQQFDEVIAELIGAGWCLRDKGPKRGTMLIVNEQSAGQPLPLVVA